MLDYGFCLETKEAIKKKPLEDLVKISKNEVSSTFKITEKHVTVEKTERQNVRKAAQLLSHTVATAIKHYELAPAYYSDFIETVNDYFDIMNSFSPNELHPAKCAYGVHLKKQNEILDKMYKQTAGMRCFKKKDHPQTGANTENYPQNCLQIFQKGILIGIKSLQNMFTDLRSRCGLSYIMTRKLNQDALENLFSQIRTKGGLYDHPSLAALNRIKLIALGKTLKRDVYTCFIFCRARPKI